MRHRNGFSATPPRLGRIAIVGASLGGLRAAETLRQKGFRGNLVIIGDESQAPYDRPPLSKHVLTGRLPVEHTSLAELHEVHAEWHLGTAATRLDLGKRQVELANGQRADFDRLLIATGTRSRTWPNPAEAHMDGIFTLRTRDDARRLRARLEARPVRVLVVGAGFIGSEVASVCRELELAVTVVDRGRAPASAALGQSVGQLLANLQLKHGVDLRCGVTVTRLEADSDGQVRRAYLSDGAQLDVDLVIAALGAIRNVEWLENSGLAVDGRGVVCDASCRAFDEDGVVLDDVFVAGDVARWPHRLNENQLLTVEHWNNAVEQARTADHNVVCASHVRRAHTVLPTFWSHQFGVNVKSVGVPPFADEVMITQGRVDEHRFVAAYGHRGRLAATVSFNMALRLPPYQALIEASAPFPPDLHAPDQPLNTLIFPARFPQPGQTTHSSVVSTTGYRLPDSHAVCVDAGTPTPVASG